MFELFFVIYILIWFNLLYMVINHPLNVPGWLFPAIDNLEKLYCVNLYYIDILKLRAYN